MLLLKRLISGGQSGSDLAGLDFALYTGLNHGGWCPKGRKAEYGRIPDDYNLKETESSSYQPRTRLNIIDSDATLILNKGFLSSGTLLTRTICQNEKKPYFVVQLEEPEKYKSQVVKWLIDLEVKTLNVAGPRESKTPGIHDEAFYFLCSVWEELSESN
jgi:hypothetical protein